jgi:hypothetical protein
MRRSFHPIRMTAGALALVLLAALLFAGNASAAEQPVIVKPEDQTNTAGKPVTLIVKGTHLTTLTATGLPTGLQQPTEVAKDEWKIEGTPTTPHAPITVTLEATNEGLTDTKSFNWTITEPEAPPKITNPGPQTSIVGKAIQPLKVEGTHLATLTDNSTLPAGLNVTKVGKEQWTITGTPTTPGESNVALEASNEENATGPPATFKWTITPPEAPPKITNPGPQTSIAGKAIEPLKVEGTHLATLTDNSTLPAGLQVTKVAKEQWTITGTPTTPGESTVTLEAMNEEKVAGTPATLKWTVKAPETPAKPVETPAKPPETPAPPPPTTIPSAGRLGTLPVQKPGKSLTASFLCEVASCQVQVTATITAGKKKFKIHSARTPVAQGQKAKLALKLSKAQQALVAAALKKHKKVSAALAASITSSVGFQVTKALVIAVKR